MSERILRAVQERLEAPGSRVPPELLDAYVDRFFGRRNEFLALAEAAATPLYVFDPAALVRRARELKTAFAAVFPDLSVYYAMKSNNYPGITGTLHEEAGFGVDVSSGVELEAALTLGVADIVFSGPGKTREEHELALAHADRVTVLLDSFGELDRLAALAADRKVVVRAGVRVTPPGSSWKKFGIPLEELGAFWNRGVSLPGIDLRGLQFHSSWNLDPKVQIATLKAIGRELASWPAALRGRVEFLDMGGGFWPPGGEWIQPGAAFAGRLGELLEETVETGSAPFYKPAAGIGTFARDLGQAVEEEIFNSGRCRICLEPGRWLCHEAMHILLRVVDRKEPDLAITDGGTNAVGWERFESDYVPVLNLTRPALRENRCQVVGSLCTPHDFWGYSYWGAGIEPGDLLLIPDQGAYTYSLRQHFIKPVPLVRSLAR